MSSLPRCTIAAGLPDNAQKRNTMRRKAQSFVGAMALVLFTVVASNAAEVSVHSIVTNAPSFDHQTVTLQGTVVAIKETTSRRGNDYTSSGDSISIFTWGHPTLTNGDRVRVDGVFETVHHQGPYAFYNEIEATKVTPLSQ